MARQGRIIQAISSQQKENSLNLQRRYAHYPRTPILKRRRNIHGATEVLVNTMRVSTLTKPLLPPYGSLILIQPHSLGH